MSLVSGDRWAVLKSFFASKGLVRQHLDSYNDFVEKRIQQIVSDVGKIEPDIPNFYVRLGRIEIHDPSVREADGSVRNIAPFGPLPDTTSPQMHPGFVLSFVQASQVPAGIRAPSSFFASLQEISLQL